MNYFEHHIGDYDSATAHLSWLEDGAYRRLICLYYRSEQPIPPDLKQACRLVRAQSKQERDAVADVLREFFELRDDGWHNARCDEEIARFQDKQRKARASADARWKGRQSQSDGNANAYANASADAMRTHSEGNATREHARPRAPARPHSPSTNTQTQEQGADLGATVARAHVREAEPPPTPTRAGQACLALKAEGIADVAPSHPRLQALLAAGVSDAELLEGAQAALRAGKATFAYTLAVVEGRRRDAANAAPVPPGAPPPRDDRKSRQLLTAALLTGAASATEPETIDVDARVVPPRALG